MAAWWCLPAVMVWSRSSRDDALSSWLKSLLRIFSLVIPLTASLVWTDHLRTTADTGDFLFCNHIYLTQLPTPYPSCMMPLFSCHVFVRRVVDDVGLLGA
jgi:hypothetical protein